MKAACEQLFVLRINFESDIFRTVHLRVILVDNQLEHNVFYVTFI